jgi:uncharacterized membrane protein
MKKNLERLLWIGLFMVSVFLWVMAIYLMFEQ